LKKILKLYIVALALVLTVGLVGLSLATAQDMGGSSSSEASYVGAAKCKNCHPQEFSDFSKRKFSKSWKILKMRGEESNAKCLKCHVTGHGGKDGFVSEAKTPHLIGKQCEACHGPGSKHMNNPADAMAKKELNISNKKNICIECHLCMTTHRTMEF